MKNKETEVTVMPVKHKYTRHTAPVVSTETTDWEVVAKRTQAELNLAQNKVTELTKIVESMKGQYAQLEKVLNNERVKNQATKDYMLDTIKHAYISLTMAAKQEV